MPKSNEINITASRASGRDCLIHQESANEFLMGLARHEATSKADVAQIEADARESLAIAYGYDDSEPEGPAKPFVYKDGIAVIPVHGTLLNRFNGSWGFVTGYNYIRRQMNLAAFDDDVEMIVLDIDSPGGEAAGNFELCREIMELREDKPILAVVDSRCMSGGYSIGASCTRMMAIPSASIGSIGVYRMHMDISGAMNQQGVKVTFAVAGEHKTDGNPFEPLPDSVLKDWEESAGKTWDDFISVVADGRDLPVEDVRATQARVYRADEALALGLIDAVKTPSEAVAAFVAELADDKPLSDEEEEIMDTKGKKAGQEATSDTTNNSAPQSVSADAIAAAITAHENQKRERRVAIRSLPEAEGRDKLVQTLIEDTDNTPEQCKMILASAGKDSVEAAPPAGDDDEGEGEDDNDDAGKEAAKGKQPADNVNHFAAIMGNSEHPNIGSGTETGGSNTGEKSDAEMAQDILGAQALAGGRKLEKTA